MDIAKRGLLAHSIADIRRQRPKLQVDLTETTRFDSLDMYSNMFHDLLLEEMRASIRQVGTKLALANTT